MRGIIRQKAGIIYLIINKVNNKKYIGQTTRKRGFKDRYQTKGEGIERVYNFLNNSKQLGETYNKHLLNSIKKYGVDNFQILEELDMAFSREELDEKEIFWINHFNSIDPRYGYNNTLGGDGGKGYSTIFITKEEYISFIGSRYKPVICLDTNEVFLTISDASKKTGINPSSIRRNCIGEINQTGKNDNEKLRFKFMTPHGYIEGMKSKPVYCSTDEKFFRSPTEAGIYYGIDNSHIYGQLKSKNPSGIKVNKDNDGRRIKFFSALDYLMNTKLRPNNT